MKCVYCLKTETETSFRSEEHIISQCLGGEPFPVITGDFVCDHCNNVTFGRLETIFKQDTFEGVYAQMLGFSDTVWVNGRYFELSDVGIFNGDMLNSIFPYLKFVNGKEEIVFRSQLKVKNRGTGFQVFPIEYLSKVLNSGPRKEFEKIKNRLSKVGLKDLRVFAGSDVKQLSEEMDACINIIKQFGVQYKENERIYEIVDSEPDKKVTIDFRAQFNTVLARVVAKIAFNYFIYSSIQEGKYYCDALYRSCFDAIRYFALNGEGEWTDIVTVDTQSPGILDLEITKGKRVVAHTICFYLVDGVIKAKISLFGKWVYEVSIGAYPFRTIPVNFGCGHAFNPFSKEAYPITKDKYSITRRIDSGYGWFMI
jgi:hypothetical protein